MTAVEHQLSDIQRELGSVSDFIRSTLRQQRYTEIGDQSGSTDSLRRRKQQLNVTDSNS